MKKHSQKQRMRQKRRAKPLVQQVAVPAKWLNIQKTGPMPPRTMAALGSMAQLAALQMMQPVRLSLEPEV